MKKMFVSGLAVALAAGANTVALAGANPFEDVPVGHWAYDAVAQLAKDGVVEGYGDGTYVGETAITRYEMAQMVARAMTKSGLRHTDKAMTDRLAAEFRDELSRLGVRVANLENKADNVKYSGYLRYTWQNKRLDKRPKHGNTNELRLRLYMDGEINENWSAHGRLEYISDMKSAKNTQSGSQKNFVVNRIYVEGQYKNINIKYGKLPYYTMVDDGMIFDDDLAGMQVEYGKKVKTKFIGGVYNTLNQKILGASEHIDSNSNYVPALESVITIMGLEVYSQEKKLNWGASYHYLGDVLLFDDHIGISAVGFGYRFNDDWALKGSYARAGGKYLKRSHTPSKQAYNIEVDYKGADMKKPGSWGAFIAYRHLGHLASIAPTYNSMWVNEKGWNAGVKVAMMRNVLGYLEYFQGKKIDGEGYIDGWFHGGTKTRTIFGRIETYF